MKIDWRLIPEADRPKVKEEKKISFEEVTHDAKRLLELIQLFWDDWYDEEVDKSFECFS